MKLNIITLLFALGGLTYAVITHGPLPWTPLRIFALCLFVPSAFLLILARIELGSSFSARPKATALVTSGLYSRIRNPIYLFGALALASVALYYRPMLLLALLVLVPMQIWRTRMESKVLEEKFGEGYRQYRARTWF